MRPQTPLLLLVAALLVAAAARVAPAQQTATDFDRDRWSNALNVIKKDIKDNYYDPTFRGKDLDAHFKAASERVKQAQSIGQIFGIIAQALLDFEDSHLVFIPPGRSARFEYGWRMQMIGERCFITAVKPGSDAEAKGVKPGDEVVGLDGYQPTRENHWKMRYAYNALRPQPAVRLLLARPDGKQQQLDVATKVTPGKRVMDLTGQDLNIYIREIEDDERERRESSRTVEAAADLLVWKMATFSMTEAEVDNAMSKARKYKSLVLDLRGNGGGAEKALLRMIGNFFDRDVKLGDIRRRKELKPLVAKARGGDEVFKGELVVLIDSQSGSAAELFARVVQLEKRGVVVGDRSAGAVMRSRFHPHNSGLDVVAPYGANITDADIVMPDGQSLEHVGVTPDKPMLPTAADMAAGRDTVLAYAASLLGVKLDAGEAGTFFPVTWRK
ncbi:MAG TPA: S41 family peptidase [Pyrinomonadaceae bacterium]|jgi:carboxyl-terminal processing protease